MPDTVDFSWDVVSVSGLLDSLASDPSVHAKTQALARLRQLQTEGAAHLKHHAEELANLYGEAVRCHSDPEELAQAAAILAEKERSAAELLAPRIEKLRQSLAKRVQFLDAELRVAFQANIDIGINWLKCYREARMALLRLADERRETTSEVFRARPMRSEIDYAELSREHIARYPKIRARLAE